MARQTITLGSNGVVQFGKRMRPASTKHSARVTPAVKLSRLHKLLKTQRPSICVVRGEGIGDVIMTTPTIHAIKEMFGNVEITYATNTKYLGGALVKTLKHNPDIDVIIERDLIDDLNFDLVVNLQCPAINHEKKGKIPLNRIDLFANHAGVKLSDPVPRFYVQKEEVEGGEIILQTISPKEKVMLVQPFASSKARSGLHTKMKQAVIDLYKDHGVRSVVLAHSSDGSSDVLWNNVPGSLYVKDLDVRGIAGLMVHCDLVLCPDSSILHVAGALGVPTVSLFGPTPPQSRINYYKNTVALWEGEQIAACPCWYDTCPTGYACWDRLQTPDIVSKCVEHLQNTTKVKIVQLLDSIRPMQIETEII